MAFREFASGFDAGLLTPGGAAAVVACCGRIEASVSAVRALAAARAAESGGWEREGYRSAAEAMAAVTGTSAGAARRAITTGRRLAAQPEVAQAALSGALSAEQTEAVADGVAADPGSAGALLAKAKAGSLAELNEEVAAVKAAATDLEERRRELQRRRSLRRWVDRDGALHAHLFGHVEDGARLWRALDPIRRRLNVLRRQAGVRDSFEALDYDALVLLAKVAAGVEGELGFAELCELGLFPQHGEHCPSTPPGGGSSGPGGGGALSLFDDPAPPDGRGGNGDAAPPGGGPPARRVKKLAGSPAKIIVRVDLDTLLRGAPISGEVCELVGYGPIPVSVIEQLAAQDNAFIVGVLTHAERVLSVYHHRRRPNAAQRSGLEFLQPSCAAAGCNVKVGLQYDHRVEWARTHYTVFDLLDRLCPHHHNLKTRDNWALVDGTGKRPFVPPTDPRHPHHRGTDPASRGDPPP